MRLTRPPGTCGPAKQADTAASRAVRTGPWLGVSPDRRTPADGRERARMRRELRLRPRPPRADLFDSAELHSRASSMSAGAAGAEVLPSVSAVARQVSRRRITRPVLSSGAVWDAASGELWSPRMLHMQRPVNEVQRAVLDWLATDPEAAPRLPSTRPWPSLFRREVWRGSAGPAVFGPPRSPTPACTTPATAHTRRSNAIFTNHQHHPRPSSRSRARSAEARQEGGVSPSRRRSSKSTRLSRYARRASRRAATLSGPLRHRIRGTPG